MNNIFNKKPDYNVPVICSIVELIFGNIVKNEQWNKINAIYNNYTNRTYNKWEVHQFMMGKGKSAIITPLLSLHLNIIKGQKIYIIIPKHLVKQTEATLKDYIDIFQIHFLIKPA
jgi:hypothetical protein